MLLGALLVVLFLSRQMKKTTVENFDSIDDFQALDKKFTNLKARRYNAISDSMNDFLGGYLNSRGDNEDQASELIKGTMNSTVVVNSTNTTNATNAANTTTVNGNVSSTSSNTTSTG